MSPPMGVYNHFDGKEGLLNALVSDGFAEFAGVVTAIDTDPAERLRNCGRNYRTFALANPNLYTLMFSTDCEADDEVAARSFESSQTSCATARASVRSPRRRPRPRSAGLGVYTELSHSN